MDRELRQIFEKLDEIDRRLVVFERLAERLLVQGEFNMSALDDLTAEVAATTTLEASIVTLIQGIPDLIKAAGTDQGKLTALTDQLTASGAAITAAITANTPAAVSAAVGAHRPALGARPGTP